jgi:hypothetical protein
MRTLIVYDGDNLAISAGSLYPQWRKKLEKRRLNRRIIERLNLSVSTLLPAVYFRSPGNQDPRVDTPYGELTDELSGMIFRFYPTLHNHGYADEDLMAYISARSKDFDSLILITSDNDFFEFAANLARNGKSVTVMSLKRATSAPSRSMLGTATSRWLDDLLQVD